ncbi:MAG: hypothetical protein HY592_00885 [Candidatus Omnitrophica bacterium]|nr:hypothetical protein [Candidatus Omnitrophota bacterium]
MKKLTSALLVFGLALAMGVSAQAEELLDTTKSNVTSGINSVNSRPAAMMDDIHAEASKGRNAGEQALGVAVGGVVGTRKAVHQLGAGAINLLTFWIPKKEPLIKESAK